MHSGSVLLLWKEAVGSTPKPVLKQTPMEATVNAGTCYDEDIGKKQKHWSWVEKIGDRFDMMLSEPVCTSEDVHLHNVIIHC